jgi:hypothetical protein
MFDWLKSHHDSQELEHAKLRQEERDAALHPDPLEEYEVIEEDGLVVEEVSPEEYKRQLENRRQQPPKNNPRSDPGR